MGQSSSVCFQLVAALLATAAAAAADKPSCSDLGFTGLQTCSDCDILGQYVSDAELAQDCRSCCAAAPTGQKKSFRSATLEVCKHRLREFPHVETFINDKAEAFEGLDVVYRFGAFPRLVLRGGKGHKESLRVDRWKTEQIEEFLRDSLATGADWAASE